MRTIAVTNQKGGCGKTTTAINLAASLAELGRRVLLVDLDPQGHASLGLSIRIDEVKRTIYDVLLGDWGNGEVPVSDVIVTLTGTLHLAPANILLSAIEQQLAGVDGREDRLRDALREVRGRYDYAVIDTPPAVGLLTFNALRAADEILVPVETGFFSMHGLAKLLETIAVVNSEYGQETPVRVTATMYEPRRRIAREVLAEIRRHFGERVTHTVIRTNVRLQEAASFGLPITEFDPSSMGAEDYRNLASEYVAQEESGLAPLLELPVPEVSVTGLGNDSASREAEAVEGDLQHVPAEEPAVPLEEPAVAAELPAVPLEEPVVPSAAAADAPPQWSVIHPPSAEEPAAGADASAGETGREVLFTFLAPGAGEVRVAGEFNNWTPQVLTPIDPANGIWKTTFRLPSGRYQYRFVVDQTWCQDPKNPEVAHCPFGGYNSVVTVA